MNTWLLDSGPLVAYLIPDDPFHERAKSALNGFHGELITTSAVVVESMHFLKRYLEGPRRLIDFLHGADVQITESCQPRSLRLAVALMRKYADIPMDFADASLVVMANDLRLHHVCTIDRRGFSVFRTSFGRRFQIVLEGV